MGVRSWLGIVVLVIAGIGAGSGVQTPDTVERLARVRLVVTTKAASAAITVSGATIASYLSSVLDGPPAVVVSRTGGALQLSRNVPGQSAEAGFDVILADIAPGGSVAWNVTADSNTQTQIEVFSLSERTRARLIDRFVTTQDSAQFRTSSGLLASAAVEMTAAMPHLVLAHYYPWYTTETWRDPQLGDRPLRPYSTEAQADVEAEAAQARAAGIDAFVVSWQGLEAGNGFNDKRMRIALDAAQASGLRVCAYTETYVANPRNSANMPVDPQSVFEWLTDLVDRYGQHPAYLRVAGRPVIFIYAATLMNPSDWNGVIARLQSSGRNPLLIGDFSRSILLEPFDGEYQYTNVFLTGEPLTDLYRAESLRVRTYNLLRDGDRRRLWVAPVTPGFDDSLLVNRPTAHVVDRSNGSVYDEQWRTAIDTGADWVVVTSWNEWWENTEVEPSERYGRAYVDRTRIWADTFKASSKKTPPPRDR
jgi:Glycosyl hydrolase family 99